VTGKPRRKPVKRTTKARTRTTTRRRTSTSSALGAAVATAAVAFLVDASWPVKIGLILLIVLLFVGYVAVRAVLAARARTEPEPTDDQAPPA
jgi:uncharacterized membrane protein